MDIADSLRGLELAQYEQSFRDNAIDLEILSELTEEADLEKLGMLDGGRRDHGNFSFFPARSVALRGLQFARERSRRRRPADKRSTPAMKGGC